MNIVHYRDIVNKLQKEILALGCRPTITSGTAGFLVQPRPRGIKCNVARRSPASTVAIPPPAPPTPSSNFVAALRHDALSDEVRHYARRHLLDTVGVMISGAGGNVATQARGGARRDAARRQRAGARPRAPRRPDRRRLPRRHRRPRHRARRRLHQGLGASRLHRGAGGAVGRLREEGERRGADRGGGRRLRDRHRDRPRRASRPAPPRLPSDRRGRGVRRGDGGRASCAG